MPTIRLERSEWTFDENDRLGERGGFGEVFRGYGSLGPVAVKRLLMSTGAAAHREMKIGSALADRNHDHVVPVLDYGLDADGDRYYLVMPVCERSLQDKLDVGGPFSWDDAKAPILNIIAGLQEAGDIVHRDLKPGNVLLFEGTWRIADFGIAKFVEDATSLQSLRSALTPAYAAPEQWRGERPSTATDVYALGCIIYALLTGSPPFTGDSDDVREAHLNSTPPALQSAHPRLVSFVNTMLRKSPESRPGLQRCEIVLASISGTSSVASGRAALNAASAAISEERAAEDAIRQAASEVAAARKSLESEASSELFDIFNRLADEIEQSADGTNRGPFEISLGPADLRLESPASRPRSMVAEAEARSHRPDWDVASHAYLTLHCDLAGSGAVGPRTYSFSVTLVFARSPEDANFRWREISFFQPLTSRPMHEQPVALNPLGRDFAIALSSTMGAYAVAWGPFPIDGEDEGLFHDRWMALFARAASRRLLPPDQLPLAANFAT